MKNANDSRDDPVARIKTELERIAHSVSLIGTRRGRYVFCQCACLADFASVFCGRMNVSFKQKGEFVTRSIADEIVVVPVRGQVGDLDAIYNLNEVGAFIWEQCDGWKSGNQIVDAVCGEFEVAREQAEKETSEFIAALEAAGMIERSVPKA